MFIFFIIMFLLIGVKFWSLATQPSGPSPFDREEEIKRELARYLKDQNWEWRKRS